MRAMILFGSEAFCGEISFSLPLWSLRLLLPLWLISGQLQPDAKTGKNSSRLLDVIHFVQHEVQRIHTNLDLFTHQESDSS